jgi:hypothetical protein
MSYGYNPPPWTGNLNVWASNIITYLQRVASRLQWKSDDARATENGTILWDEISGYPVVAKNNEFRQIVLADGLAVLSQDADITAAVIDTAYEIPFDLVSANGITLTGTPLTDITFAEGGLYLLAFSAQCTSSSASTVTFRFWPRINGTDATGSTILSTLHSNGATMVASRTAIFTVTAGDVLNVMWSVSSLSASLVAHPATAYSPVAPSVTLAITRIRA